MENDAAKYAMEEARPRFETLANRKENGTAPRAVSSFQLFQTPAHIARQLAEIMDAPKGAEWLEPSAGLGRLLDAIKPYEPKRVYAVEENPLVAGELYRQNRPNVRLIQRDFLAFNLAQIGSPFDAVIMNPPFHLRADIRHIEHALTFLKPGGVLGALCLHTPHRVEAFRDQAETWTILPSGTFAKEGTRVECVMLTIRKEAPNA